MLKRLYISNFALISEMDVEFPGGLTIITGETGAGKSIFLEALGLTLGRRADLPALKNAAKKCVVEAEFNVRGLDLSQVFEENEVEPSADLVLRREISADGRSRAFINDSPASLNALKAFSEKLIDVHSQHQTLLLNQGAFQLEVLDAFAGTQSLFSEYKREYHTLCRLENDLKNLREQELQARKEQDYLKFVLDELEQADISTGIIQQLESESALLENAESIKNYLLSAAHVISGGEQNVLQGLLSVRQQLASAGKLTGAFNNLFERVLAVQAELKDIGAELEHKGLGLEVDNARKEDVNQRLDQLNRLLKKHSAGGEEELLKLKEEVDEKLSRYASLETTIQLHEKQQERSRTACLGLARRLSAQRNASVPTIESEVATLLSGLSMQNATFKIINTPLEEPGPSGLDQVQFLFSANKGQLPGPIEKIASGGELSRLMLSTKALAARYKQLPTVIFDEIDTGVSGQVAAKVGDILSGMGKTMQVISITHLPQIASRGHHHLFVYKSEEEGKAVSNIRELKSEARVIEIAKMLSAGTPTESAIKNASELLNAD